LESFGQNQESSMPLSAKSLHASGRISDKQMHKLSALRGTRSQPSKMARFEHKEKDEGRLGNRGEPPANEINHPTNQDRGRTSGFGGRRAPPSKGGRSGPEGQLHVKHIDQAKHQKPKFPASGDLRASNPKTGNTRMKGKIPAQGGLYGGGGRNTQ
jgi:hypothetical protein